MYQSLNLLINKSGLFSENFNIKLVQYTDKMGDYIACADLVVGKAGPNLLFEAIAMERPFLAICHIHGQEDGNLGIIRKKKLGFVEENSKKASNLLKKIIENPEMLKKFEKTIKKESLHNRQAGKILLKTLSK